MTMQRFSLSGKVALVSGASRGIGRAIAEAFAEAGADVALAARSLDALHEVAEQVRGHGRRALVLPTDVTRRSEIEAMVGATVDRFGRLDVLVNNAGGTSFSVPLLDLRPDGWDKVIRLNLDAVFHATQIGARAMAAGDGGSIINMASVAGVQGAPMLSYYSAAKGGVNLFTKAVAKELATAGIRVNALAPGWVATDLNEMLRADPEAEQRILSAIPMRRWGRVEEIAAAALFLASDASSFMTGATLVVDGGQSA